MARTVQPQTPAPGVVVPTESTTTPSKGPVPWRKATLRKAEQAAQDQFAAYPAGQQLMNRVLEGTGFLTSVGIELNCVTASNAATVAFEPDAPWNALQNVVFKDVGPDTINVTGYSLFLANIYGGHGLRNPMQSLDSNVFSKVAGAVGNGGSFRFHLDVPLAINSRSLMGAMGNQDRAVKYELRTDIAPSATVYTVAPTTSGALVVSRTLQFATVPAPVDSARMPQEQLPPHYGVVHLLNELRSESDPVQNSTINHFLRSIGNTIRTIILVFRASGVRSEAVLPTRITFRVGNDVVFSETSASRRKIMFDQFGFDAPAGVLVYSFCNDFGNGAGYELGDDWLDTRNIANAQFECTYGAFSGAGSLTVITDSLVIPEGLDISSYV